MFPGIDYALSLAMGGKWFMQMDTANLTHRIDKYSQLSFNRAHKNTAKITVLDK